MERPRSDTAFRLLLVLAAADNHGMLLEPIARAYRPKNKANRSLTGMGAMLGMLARQGLVERAGQKRHVRYRLTGAGRAWVARYDPDWHSI